MKTNFKKSTTWDIGSKLLLTMLFAVTTMSVFAQQAKKRVYARTEISNSGDVTFDDQSHDAVLSTGSVLAVNLLGGTVTSRQTIGFSEAVTNKPLHIKIGGGVGLVSLGPTISVRAFDASGNPVGAETTISSGLLSLLSGTNTYEFIYTPSTTDPYQRIRLTFSAVAIGTSSIQFYDAYYEENDSDPAITCDAVADILSGSSGALLSGITTTVENPNNATDGDLSTAATLNGAVSALNYTYVETLYKGTSAPGDSVRVLVEKPGALAVVGLLDAIEVRTRNGNTVVDTRDDAALLKIQLLPGTTKYWITFATTGNFDRIEVRLGGAVSALAALNIFEIQRVVGPPLAVASSTTIYAGNSASLTATAQGSSTLVWQPGGATGSPFNTGPLTSSTTYEVRATRQGCTSAKVDANVNVLPLPTFGAPSALIQGKTYTLASNIQIPITNGQASTNYTFSNAAGLPAGLTLTSDGHITGIPTSHTNGLEAPFTANVTDATRGIPVVTGATFQIKVYGPIVLTGGAFPSTDKFKTTYTADLTILFGSATGGLGSNYTYSLNPFTLPGGRTAATTAVPAGFTLSSAGILTGNPQDKGGSYTFPVYASDGLQQTSADFTLFISDTPLPVKLASFKAAKEGETALISWSTTEEVNSERFDLERSGNGNNWEVIGSKVSNGDSKDLNHYALTDAKPLGGQNLYRLRMIDRDGTFAFSKIEALNFKGAGISVQPNPVVGSEKIQVTVDDWSAVSAVRLLSLTGKVIYEAKGALTSGIATSNLSSGLYIVQVQKLNGSTSSYKIVKQ